MRFRPAVRRARGGGYDLRLEDWERELLRRLPAELREVLATDDPALERLYPPAYLQDEAGNADYARLMKGDLTAGKLTALEIMEATVDASRLDDEQMAAWLGALNDLRLVLGTRLDVSEDMSEWEGMAPDDPRLPALALYDFLTRLQGEVIVALSASL